MGARGGAMHRNPQPYNRGVCPRLATMQAGWHFFIRRSDYRPSMDIDAEGARDEIS